MNLKNNKKGEGKKLIENYGWFKDKSVIKEFIESVDKIANHLPKSIIMLEIGSGVGNLSYTVKDWLEKKYKKNVMLILSDLNTEDTLNKNGSIVLKVENKDLPFQDSSFDFIISRSVTHYEVNNKGEERVLNEIKRVLKTKGVYLAQSLYLSNKEEVQLFQKVNSTIAKKTNLKTFEQLLALNKRVFDNVSIINQKVCHPLVVTKDSFLKRYSLNKKHGEILLKIIKKYYNKNTSNILIDKNNFRLIVNYAILECRKPR